MISAERGVARLAARQQGMITTAQLDAAGFGRTQITRRVAGSWLVRVHTGVYQLGAFPGPWGPEAAALFACGPDAALSHWTAARIDALTDRGRAEIHVSIQGRLAGRTRGIRPHRVVALPPCDVVVRHGLRVTTPARTLLDLAAVAPRDVLERLTEEAMVQRLVSTADLQEAIGRAAGRPGVRKLREAVDFLDEPWFTRSEAEKRLRAVVRSAGLPPPRTNVKRAGWEVDAVWDAQRLVVEVDGHKYHSTRARFERDRRKDADLLLAGYRVLRFTWRRLTKESAEVVAIIAAALAHAHEERSRRR
jgi:very-short-patch-repair endonuclease